VTSPHDAPGSANALPQDPRDPEGYPDRGPGSLASIGQRAVARIIDTALIAVPLSIVTLVWFSETTDGEVSIEAPIWVVALFFALDLTYEVTMVRLFGQTLGKMILGIRIVRIPDGERPDWGQSGVRFLVPGVADAIPVWFSGFFAIGIYLTAMFDPAYRGVHDKAAGTLVLRTR
jgi:uncharacterized RDD family membrane protein YckC